MSYRVRLSAAPIDWGVAELVPGNPDPIELLDWVATVGYAGCELGTHGYFGMTSQAILDLFRPRNLAVTASWYDVELAKPLTPESAAEIDLICSFLEAGGANVINISAKITDERAAVVGRIPSFPETWWPDEAWTQVPITLQEVHEVTSKRGVQVAVHQHVATHIESEREMRKLIEAIARTSLRLCLDTGHLMLGGADPIALLNEVGDRVIHVHAKDVDGPALARLRAGEIDYFAATGMGLYSDLGTGIVDWQGLRASLDSFAYNGWVVAEQDRLLVPGSRSPFDANKRNYAFLAGLFDAQ
jgi:inosose dehydratase